MGVCRGTFQIQMATSQHLEICSCSSTLFYSPVLSICLLNNMASLYLGASLGRIYFVCGPGPGDSKWILGVLMVFCFLSAFFHYSSLRPNPVSSHSTLTLPQIDTYFMSTGISLRQHDWSSVDAAHILSAPPHSSWGRFLWNFCLLTVGILASLVFVNLIFFFGRLIISSLPFTAIFLLASCLGGR